MKKFTNPIKLNFEDRNIKMELTEDDSGLFQIVISQIFSKNGKRQQLILDTPILKRFIEALENYQKLIYTPKLNKDNLYKNHIKIEERYLRGVSIKDLAMQFEETEEAIKNLLTRRGIEIVDLSPPRKPYRGWKKR